MRSMQICWHMPNRMINMQEFPIVLTVQNMIMNCSYICGDVIFTETITTTTTTATTTTTLRLLLVALSFRRWPLIASLVHGLSIVIIYYHNQKCSAWTWQPVSLEQSSQTPTHTTNHISHYHAFHIQPINL